jgi:NAD-dependent deacetylase
LRPHIVWFGEDVPALQEAKEIIQKADYFVVVGTSLQVYPAAGLIEYINPKIPIYYIDPNPISIRNLSNTIEIIPMNAGEGIPFLRTKLISLNN